MATQNLPSYDKGTVLRLANQTEPAEAVFTLLIPDGTAVTAGGEVYKVVRLGEGHVVQAVSLEVSGSLAASGLTFDAGTSTTADCFVDGWSGGNGSGGTILVEGGLVTASGGSVGGGFADGYVAPATSPVDLQFTIVGTATTPVTSGDRTISMRVKYSRPMPEAQVVGVSNVLYPFAGNLVVKPATEYDYNGNAP